MRQIDTRTGQRGFTVIELMIATLVFGTILVVITSGVIHFTTDYYKGVNTSSTQTAARKVMTTIAQNIEYGGAKAGVRPESNAESSGNKYGICLGTVQINYQLGYKLGSTSGTDDYGVVVGKMDPANGCKLYDGSGGTELLGPNMRLTNLDISPGPSGLYTVVAGVAYGDDDLLCDASVSPATDTYGCSSSTDFDSNAYTGWLVSGASIRCKGGAGSQFCAVSHLSTQIGARFQAVEGEASP